MLECREKNVTVYIQVYMIDVKMLCTIGLKLVMTWLYTVSVSCTILRTGITWKQYNTKCKHTFSCNTKCEHTLCCVYAHHFIQIITLTLNL